MHSGPLRYNPALDGIRGFAVIAVVLCHADEALVPGGGTGVDLFFVLSGYLISSLLRDEFAASGKIDFLRFYIRRAARLMPPLWCMLLAFLPFILFGHHRADLIKPWLATAAYTMNWNRAFAWWPHYAFGHTWSLAAEEQFYILWPGLFLLVRARKPLLWLSATIAIITFWRFHLVATGAPLIRTYNGFDTHADPISAGLRSGLHADTGSRLGVFQ